MTTVDRAALRKEIRQRRRALSPDARHAAAQAVADRIAATFRLPAGSRVGAYLTYGAELDTRPLLELAVNRGWSVYVPVITHVRAVRMRFVPLRGELRVNRYGIHEPTSGRTSTDWIAPRWLDLVFVPLLGVGPQGERLGAGAGFYDRAFSYRRQRIRWHKPPLIGLAYELQRVTGIQQFSWDVPLDGLVTERTLYRFAR